MERGPTSVPPAPNLSLHHCCDGGRLRWRTGVQPQSNERTDYACYAC